MMFLMEMNDIAWLLSANDSLLILTHRRPDGDTLGSAAALCRGLRKLGKTVYLQNNEDVTPKYQMLTEGLFAPEAFKPRFTVAVDIADEDLLPPSAQRYAGSIDMCIDHHPSNTGYAGHVLLMPKAAATGEIIMQLLDALRVEPDADIFDAVYIAIATDTGCFMFSNTTPLSHEIAARCIAGGIDFHAHNRKYFQKKSKMRFLIERHVMEGAVFFADDRVGIACLTRDFIEELGAGDDDIDNLSTMIMQLEGICCGALLTETRDRSGFKASVRTHVPLDASKICKTFSGGGHARAAGCTINRPREECISLLSDAILKELAVC